MGFYKNTNGVLTPIAGGVSNSYAPIGAIYPYGGTSAPSGYLMCDGSAVSRTDYAALFAVIGTSFGAGDGSTTFNVPDLRGEFLRGAGTNSHSGQGNGGTVGQHQDATIHNNAYAYPTYSWIAENKIANVDAGVESSMHGVTAVGNTASVANANYTSRPTNTSVNYIIKAKDVNLSVGGQALADRVSVLETVNTMTVTKQGNYINGTNFYGRRVGNVAMIEIDGATGSSIPWGQTTIIGITTGCAVGIMELKCTADMLDVITGYDANSNAITRYIPPYSRSWIDAAGQINVFLANPGSADTSYTKNLFIGGSYITQ